MLKQNNDNLHVTTSDHNTAIPNISAPQPLAEVVAANNAKILKADADEKAAKAKKAHDKELRAKAGV